MTKLVQFYEMTKYIVKKRQSFDVCSFVESLPEPSESTEQHDVYRHSLAVILKFQRRLRWLSLSPTVSGNQQARKR